MNTICRLLVVFVLAAALYLAMNLLPDQQQKELEHFHVGHHPHRDRRGPHRHRRRHWGWPSYGNRSWWYWGLPRWSRVPTVAYPCNPFWSQNCPAFLYNPYSYLYSYK